MTSHRLLSLAAGVSPELAADPVALLSAAADAGWPAAGVWFDPATWTETTTRAVRGRLADTGLTAVDVEVIRLGPGGDHGDAIVDVAAELGAANVLAISGFEDPGETADRLGSLCERAAPAGVRVCLEFMRFTAVRNLADALDVVRRVDHPSVGILVDLLHVARSGTGFAEIEATDPQLFPYVQWCDGPAEPSGWSTAEIVTDALDARCAPGEGDLDAGGFERLFDPEVPFSMEVRSKALRDGFPDHTERAAHLLATTRRALGD
ncbi:MAG: sugar phosphate isomerase/epimerase [Actinomycetota bacterium]